LDNLFCVLAETRFGRFLQAYGFRGDDVHERPALCAGEGDAVELLRVLRLAHHQAAARAAQRLVRGGGNVIGVRHRAWMHAPGDEAGDVRHVHEK
jgi:hypothetical protein